MTTQVANKKSGTTGSFFVVISPDYVHSQEMFRRGLDVGMKVNSKAPGGIIDVVFARAASFPRADGLGGAITADPATGNWLIAAGSWFDAEGCASGNESALLKRIEEEGALHVANGLEGFFTIVFCDARLREIIVITDLIGSRHCFMRVIGGSIVLSTSSLLLAALGDATPDKVGCEEFLRTGAIYEDRTLWREVKKLAPASIYRFDRGRQAETVSYWRITDLNPDEHDGETALAQLSDKLVNAARRIGRVYSFPVCDLTGGYDSRSVAAAMLTAGVPFETTVVGEKDDRDVVISKSLSRLIGVQNRHYERKVDVSLDKLRKALRLTDGECDLVEYSLIHQIHSRLSVNYDASLNGSLGEIARGYWWELLIPRVGACELLDPYKLAAKRYATGSCSPDLYPQGHGINLVDHFAVMINRANRGMSEWPNTIQMDNAYLMLRMQRWQGRIASSTDQVWPCLSPFMFRSVLETALQTTARARKQSRLIRRMITKLQPQMAAQPLDAGYPPMPFTLGTWPHFLPATWRYPGWVLGRACKKLLKRQPNHQPPEQARLQLWSDEETREILEPREMQLSGLIDPLLLHDFIEAAQQPEFAYDPQWQRVLSLEMTMQFRLKDLRVSSSGENLIKFPYAPQIEYRQS
jgi:asparagine synthase (glutamine-hydrolysing)